MLLPSALGFSPHPPVSVYGTGTVQTIAAFLGSRLTHFPTLVRYASHLWVARRFFQPYPSCACPWIPFQVVLSFCVPTVLLYCSTVNLNLLSIGYASRPRLRSRLPQGRSALPWKPWIFGRKDSHLTLATHSGILSS